MIGCKVNAHLDIGWNDSSPALSFTYFTHPIIHIQTAHPAYLTVYGITHHARQIGWVSSLYVNDRVCEVCE